MWRSLIVELQAQPHHPSLIKLDLLHCAVARFGRERKIPVSLCGDMASDPRYLETLLKLGLRSLSVASPSIDRVKEALSDISLGSSWMRKLSSFGTRLFTLRRSAGECSEQYRYLVEPVVVTGLSNSVAAPRFPDPASDY
jgi:PEP-utilizing family enzyme